ncbi:insulin-like growth factor-binding protein 1b isoform X2 [Trichomycterus rosablanca]|uniref:insulin-like growth factor-binding protein 1b isoform X2 n=1 Tax=Trichomycterus rosablanca TaxID=2290929 RepID=UPI002F352BBC
MRGLQLFFCFVSVLSPAALSPLLVPEPIRCAPCTAEKLSACPTAPTGCLLMREPGCGCCPTCALSRGASCGVYTAHCAPGLRCTPRDGDTHPLHSLTRGHGVCTDDHAAQEDDEEEYSSSLHHLLALDKAGDPEAHEGIRAKVNAIKRKLVQLGPCHTELHSALDTITASQQALGENFASFYLPNCDKHGFYKSKQCETSLVGQPARCWCVSAWNGKRITGSSDVPEDALCHQEVTH